MLRYKKYIETTIFCQRLTPFSPFLLREPFFDFNSAMRNSRKSGLSLLFEMVADGVNPMDYTKYDRGSNMLRRASIDAPGAVHHIICRGIERRAIFQDDVDRDDFVNRLGKTLKETSTLCCA